MKGRIFNLTIYSLIIVSLVAFSIETLPGLSAGTYTFLYQLETSIVIIFTCEYLLRVITTKNKLSYIFSFYGIIDLLAILPFYLSANLSLQALRALRLFRLLRVLKLARYNQAISNFVKAIQTAKEELILFSIITLILLYLSAVGIYHFEHTAQPNKFKSIFDSLWWAVSTFTTVGYGDIYPITVGGRLFTFGALILGLGVIAVPTGIIASALYSVRKGSRAI